MEGWISRMSSKRRIRRKSCMGKIIHDQQSAIRHAIRLRRMDNSNMCAYKCLFGNHWHVGHYARGNPWK
jgi:hypothetical protein